MKKLPKNLLIGVTGGIAAYKVADLVSSLRKRGHGIQVIMTENSKKFITPLTLATLSKKPVLDDASEWVPDGNIKHIELGKWCYMYVIVPATANTLVKLWNGTADNLLTSTYLALPKDKRVIICPAMNVNMWENEQTQKIVTDLKLRPFHKVVSPAKGELACGDTGTGKLPPVDQLVQDIEGHFAFLDD